MGQNARSTRALFHVDKALSLNVQYVARFESRTFNTWYLDLSGIKENEPVCCGKLSIILSLSLITPVTSFVIDLPKRRRLNLPLQDSL
jgi:hypothetical protein